MSRNLRYLLAFFAIYVVWGSTYLGIRYAVETIPPLATAGVRHLIAGSVLYFWARRSGPQIDATQWRASFVLAAFFFLIGHGTLHWAEQVVPSGIAAVLIATEPLWITLMMPGATRSRFTLRVIAGLATGLGGVALVVPHDAVAADQAQLLGSGAILLSAISWSVGIRYAATAPLPRDPFLRTSATLLCGGVLLISASALAGELGRIDVRAISTRSLLALGYLIVFGSIVAFSAYTWLLERIPATFVATHTYVNPVVAVLVGWAFAGEALTPQLLAGTALILAALVLLRSTPSARRPVVMARQPAVLTLPRRS